jgi:ribosome maturation factor RimP
MQGSGRKIAQEIEAMVGPLCASLGTELVQVVYRRESNGWVLRILLDKAGGITLGDCKQFSHEFSDLLMVEEVIDNAYRLEVSSPGLDRPLVKTSDFEKFAGCQIKMTTCRLVDGKKKFTGELIGIQGQTVTLDSDGTRHDIDFQLIDTANLVPKYNGISQQRDGSNRRLKEDAVQSQPNH